MCLELDVRSKIYINICGILFKISKFTFTSGLNGSATNLKICIIKDFKLFVIIDYYNRSIAFPGNTVYIWDTTKFVLTIQRTFLYGTT